MERIITKETLISLIKETKKNEFTKKYRAWKELSNNDLQKFTLIGTFSLDNNHEAEFSSDKSYWSVDYPIALNHYPYNGCNIYSYEQSYFFVYRDFGGHAPEKRCRFINHELIT